MIDQVSQERGLGKWFKQNLPRPLFRPLAAWFVRLMAVVPYRIKVPIGAWLRRGRAPYRFLKPSDTVIQVGCARDLLRSGRSRVLYFSQRLKRGQVVVVEADPDNCRVLNQLIEGGQLPNVRLAEACVWDRPADLAFLSSSRHPASSLVEAVRSISPRVASRRGYGKRWVRAEPLDRILRDLALEPPALVSITTNGAELRILDGMSEILNKGCEYVSLASTTSGLRRTMANLGYRLVAHDDRGYCFQKTASPGPERPTEMPVR